MPSISQGVSSPYLTELGDPYFPSKAALFAELLEVAKDSNAQPLIMRVVAKLNGTNTGSWSDASLQSKG